MINIKTDHRKIKKGDTFVAIKGHTVDGHDFIEDAIKNGATKIICERGSYKVETKIVKNTKIYLRNYLKRHYSHLFNDLKLIAVTGTNGKTTTCYLLYESLIKLKQNAAYIGTIGFYMNGKKVRDLPNTTPEITEIYLMLLEAKHNNVTYIFMEASSHSLSEKRLYGLLFDIALFTNLTKDHLDYHNNFRNYANAKKNLFKNLKNKKIAIVNNDDKFKNYFLINSNYNVTYGFSQSDFRIIDTVTNNIGSVINVKFKNKDYIVKTKLSGKYNVYNITCVFIVLYYLGYAFKDIINVIHELDAPTGRMEKYYDNTNTIVIDYAHTPDAVFNVITTAKDFTKGRIITLIGCGGERDKTKRPEMAQIATDLSDYAIFSSDNPRNEDPEEILDDMVRNLKNTNFLRISNREQAIKKAISLLRENDTLLLLGKGHETYQIIGNNKIPFSDKEVSHKYLNKKDC